MMNFRILAVTAIVGAALLGAAAAAPLSAATGPGGQYKATKCVPGRPGCQHPPGYRPGPHFYFWYWPYPPPYYYNYYYPPYAVRLPMSCSAAKRLLARDGYKRLVTKDCKGKYYEFTGYMKGRKYKIRLNAYTGRYHWSTLRS
jgi:hypothetical protein